MSLRDRNNQLEKEITEARIDVKQQAALRQALEEEYKDRLVSAKEKEA